MKSDLIRDQVPYERVQEFAQAVGAKVIGDEVPPTYITIFRDGEFSLLERLGIPLAKVLHADQEYQYDLPVRAGDEIEYVTELVQVLEKHGRAGSMSFLTFETNFKSIHNHPGQNLCKSRSLIIFRESPEKSGGAP